MFSPTPIRFSFFTSCSPPQEKIEISTYWAFLIYKIIQSKTNVWLCIIVTCLLSINVESLGLLDQELNKAD